MTPDRSRQVERLFEGARGRPAGERAAYLDGACGSDFDLRREVASLLAQADSRDTFLPPAVAVTNVARAIAPGHLVGRSFGSYEFANLIGTGGMGEVYRARDRKLGRDVAIKVLPPDLTADPSRRARFEREARVLAAFTHPNIATIHAVEALDGQQALVMELVDGDTLEARIARGPMKPAEALGIASQIAEALEAAHEKGIIHRDLKPANVKVTPNGQVKVLDFGLAKAQGSGPRGVDEAQTMTADGTLQGMVVGTPAYMSPEQTRGQTVDTRTDIWAFGCVLFELLSGRRAFEGKTVSDIVAAVLERDPPWPALPAGTHAVIVRLLRRCLTKDVRQRWRDIGDARIEIADLVDATSPELIRPEIASSASAARSRAFRWQIATLVVGVPVVLAGAWVLFGDRQLDVPALRVTPLTSFPGSEGAPSLSPDGSQVAFTWNGGQAGNDDIYVQVIGAEAPVRLTTNPASDTSPVWSPTDREIAFIRRGTDRDTLFVVSATGGTERRVGDLTPVPPLGPVAFPTRLLSWSPDAKWLAVAGRRTAEDRAIVGIAADGSARRVIIPAGATNEAYESPAFSPTGRALAFATCIDTQCHLDVVGLGPTLQATGPPRRLSREPGVIAGITWSEDGRSLIYGAAPIWPNTFHLWRVLASGESAPERIDFAGVGALPAGSIRGGALAYSRRDFDFDIWEWDGREQRPIASSTFSDYDASYSPDGSRVAFVTDRAGAGAEIWTANRDGTGRLSLTKGAGRAIGSPRWSRDGRFLAFDGVAEDGRRHVWTINAAGGQPVQVTSGEFASSIPSWSSDGQSIYFVSPQSGSNEVWRVPSRGGQPTRVTLHGGIRPFEGWEDGTLYYVRDGKLFGMPVAGGPERQVLPSLRGTSYWPMKGRVYYLAAQAPGQAQSAQDLMVLDLATGISRALFTIRLPYVAGDLSAAPDGRVLFGGVASIGADLMLIRNFR